MRQKILAASLFSVCLLLGVGFESSALAQSDPVDGSLSGTLATDSNTEESLVLKKIVLKKIDLTL